MDIIHEPLEAEAADANPSALIPLTSPAVAPYEAPTAVVDRATEQANVLMDIVESKQLFANIQGKKYLTAEAWETILAFNNCSPREVETVAVKGPNGETFGWKATVALVDERTGIEVARASMIAGLDDFPSQGRTGTGAHRAAMSAAQTWAVSKAARIKFSWVAVLAGYEPTPSSEMDDAPSAIQGTPVRGQIIAPPARMPAAKPRSEKTGNMCPLHNKPFYRPTDAQVAAGFTQPSHSQPGYKKGFCHADDDEVQNQNNTANEEVEELEW